MTTTHEQVRLLLDEALRLLQGTEVEPELRALAGRLDGPLRVAVAGRVKAGKSTLLNALVGEKLAPTDAGECTKIVSWYREGLGYEVDAELHSGERRSLSFSRADGSLDVQLGDLQPAEVRRLDISWPAASLRQLTLIDTPGLESINDENSLRTREFMAVGESGPGESDAVIYLMRHLHRNDVEFLGSFLDQATSGTSPVNSIGILSRADEIGSCRLDALDSARRIAARLAADPVVSTLCSTVLPVAGLIAETGQTFREDEASAVRALADTEAAELEQLLRSADDFLDPGRSQLTAEIRQLLLNRLGLFGLRLLVDRAKKGEVRTAGDMARLLVAESGLDDLRRAIRERFLPRAKTLQARTALAALTGLKSKIAAVDQSIGERLAGEVERIEASATEFGDLRLEHLVRSAAIRLNSAEVDEVFRVLAGGFAVGGEGEKAPRPEELRQIALAGVERWRTRGSDPLGDAALREAAETMARRYEAKFLSLES